MHKKCTYNLFPQSIYGPVCLKSTFERGENTAVSAAILCLATCVYAVVNNFHIDCVAELDFMSLANHFLLFTGRERTNMAAPWGAQIRSKKKKKKEKKKRKFCCENHMKPGKGNVCIFVHLLRFVTHLCLRFGTCFSLNLV